MANNFQENFDPQVYAYIEPIIAAMTQIDIAQRTQPYLNDKSEPESMKEMKKSCVHIINESNNEPKIAVSRNNDGDLVCRVCGRKINTKFDADAVETLEKAGTILNQLLLFGMFHGLAYGPVRTIIDIKRVLPSLIARLKELNTFIANESKSNEANEGNIGTEYAINNMRSITGFTAPY